MLNTGQIRPTEFPSSNLPSRGSYQIRLASSVRFVGEGFSLPTLIRFSD